MNANLAPAPGQGPDDLIFASDTAEASVVGQRVPEPGAAREMPLMREYLGILERRKWVILGVLLLAVLGGLAATLMMTPQYTASARIEISRQEQRITNVEGLQKSDRTFDQEFYDTQYQLLKARSVAERVARELRLPSDFAFFEAHGIDPATTEWLGDPGAATDRETLEERRKAAVGLLLENIEISPIPRSALVESATPAPAPRFPPPSPLNGPNNLWRTAPIAGSIPPRMRANCSNAASPNCASVWKIRKPQLVTYANEKGIVVLESSERDGRTVGSQTLAQLDLQAMNKALLAATEARVEMQARAGAASGTNADLIANSTINALRRERAARQAEYARLMVQFEPGYPAAKALEVQIAELNAAIEREEARVRSSAQTDYRAALAREGNLKRRVAALDRQA